MYAKVNSSGCTPVIYNYGASASSSGFELVTSVSGATTNSEVDVIFSCFMPIFIENILVETFSL